MNDNFVKYAQMIYLNIEWDLVWHLFDFEWAQYLKNPMSQQYSSWIQFGAINIQNDYSLTCRE